MKPGGEGTGKTGLNRATEGLNLFGCCTQMDCIEFPEQPFLQLVLLTLVPDPPPSVDEKSSLQVHVSYRYDLGVSDYVLSPKPDDISGGYGKYKSNMWFWSLPIF